MEFGIQVLMGQMIPWTVDLINRHVANSKVRFWIAFAVCLFFGVLISIPELTTLINDPSIPHLGMVFQAGIIIFTSSQIAYKTYYENSILQAKIRYPRP